MTGETLETVKVEELEAGDYVKVGARTGIREVLEVKRFPSRELEGKLGRPPVTLPESVVVVYRPPALGEAFENRARAARGTSHYHRSEASFCKQPGDLVERRIT